MKYKYWIGFAKGNSLIAKIIEWFTNSIVSHCFMYYKDENGMGIVVESDWGGVTKHSYNPHPSGRKIVCFISPDWDLSEGMKWAKTCRNYHYAIDADLGEILVILLKKIGIRIRNIFHFKNEINCSQFVARILQESKYPPSLNIVWDNMTPGDIMELVVNGIIPFP